MLTLLELKDASSLNNLKFAEPAYDSAEQVKLYECVQQLNTIGTFDKLFEILDIHDNHRMGYYNNFADHPEALKNFTHLSEEISKTFKENNIGLSKDSQSTVVLDTIDACGHCDDWLTAEFSLSSDEGDMRIVMQVSENAKKDHGTIRAHFKDNFETGIELRGFKPEAALVLQ